MSARWMTGVWESTPTGDDALCVFVWSDFHTSILASSVGALSR
jgi:hypothetical protein